MPNRNIHIAFLSFRSLTKLEKCFVLLTTIITYPLDTFKYNQSIQQTTPSFSIGALLIEKQKRVNRTKVKIATLVIFVKTQHRSN